MLDEIIIAVVRYKGQFRWFRCERELWILDLNKLRKTFIENGYNVPKLDEMDRFGIHTLTPENIEFFLEKMRVYEIATDELSYLLANRYPTAKSWWDVGELFPTVFVNFDNKTLGAFYYEGTKMELYIPDGWKGEFVDFANEYSEDIFPSSEKFWIKEDSDLLKLLNERGAKK